MPSVDRAGRPLKTTLRSPATWLLLAAALAPGCSRRPAELPAPPAATAKPLVVQTIDPAQYEKILQQRRGRVVLVDFWATWCQPCLELFPHAVELQRRLGERGLTVISFSVDDPDQEEAVKAVLARQGGRLENLLSRDGAGAQSFSDYQIEGGALPHLKLYDRRGKLRKTFSGGQSPIDPRKIDAAVEELLRESE